MADVFISYAREDRSRAEQVAQALRAAGIEAFWDTEIPPGKTWADYIEGKLTACKALIVLWSEHSTKSQWVREEARLARDKHKLIPAMLDASPAPFGFGEVQAANLAGWNGDRDDPSWKRVEDAVRNAIGLAAANASAGEGAPGVAPPPASPASPPAAPQQFASMIAANPSADAHSPLEYIKKCLRHYADGKGRARRSEFWWFALFYFGLLVIAAIFDSASGFDYATGMPNSYLFSAIVFVALICPMVSVVARRFHDAGLNGWLAALGFVPWLGALFVMVIGFIPGQPGVNKYGPNPKGG